MTILKPYKSFNVLFVFFQIIFSIISSSSFSQTKPSYRNHEEIDVGSGMKVEILKCYGEGPAEECDCIYFTDKRQTGTRMKQNANRLREDERAANLAKGINEPVVKYASAVQSTDSRTDKAIPAFMIPDPDAKATPPPPPTLEEAVKKADSAAKASSQKMKEALAKISPANDSTEMDKVYIPKVTETGATRLDASHLMGSADLIPRDTIAKEMHKDTAIGVTPQVLASSPIKDIAAIPVETTTGTTAIKNPPAVTNLDSSDTNLQSTIKSATTLTASAVNSVSNALPDTADNGSNSISTYSPLLALMSKPLREPMKTRWKGRS
jgi:hypothetical protein